MNSLSHVQAGNRYPEAQGPNKCNFFDMTADGIASMLNNYSEHYYETNKKMTHGSADAGSNLIEFEESDSDTSSKTRIPVDESTEYLHVMLTSGQDQCSTAEMTDVLNCLHSMK